MAICDDTGISISLFHEQLGKQNHAHTLFLYKYGLGEKNICCLFTHSCVLQLLQLLLFATTIYLSKMIDKIPLRSMHISCRHVHRSNEVA